MLLFCLPAIWGACNRSFGLSTVLVMLGISWASIMPADDQGRSRAVSSVMGNSAGADHVLLNEDVTMELGKSRQTMHHPRGR